MVLSKFCFLIFFVVDWNFASLEKLFIFVVSNSTINSDRCHIVINSDRCHIVAYFLCSGKYGRVSTVQCLWLLLTISVLYRVHGCFCFWSTFIFSCDLFSTVSAWSLFNSCLDVTVLCQSIICVTLFRLYHMLIIVRMLGLNKKWGYIRDMQVR